jgi:hypothetical protein
MVTSRGEPFGWGTSLKAGSLLVRFFMLNVFFIGCILSAVLGLWGRLSNYREWGTGIFPSGQVKCVRCLRQTTLSPSVTNCLEIRETQPARNLSVFNRHFSDPIIYLYFTRLTCCTQRPHIAPLRPDCLKWCNPIDKFNFLKNSR